MKTLGRYEKHEDPVLLRKDYLHENQGIGYHGSKMKEAELLFTYNITPSNNAASVSYLKPKASKRSSSSMLKKVKSPHRPPSNVR